jgi:hypothetical protein
MKGLSEKLNYYISYAFRSETFCEYYRFSYFFSYPG